MSAEGSAASAEKHRCPHCQEPVAWDIDTVVCQRCVTRHHRACWTAAGRCATCAWIRRMVTELPAARPLAPAPRADAVGPGDGAGGGDVSLQARVDHVLNEPDSPAGRLAELVIGVLILGVIAIYVLDSTLDPAASPRLHAWLLRIETGMTAVFFLEYLVRWWARRFSVRYLFTPLALVDLAACLPLFLPSSRFVFVRVLRLFRVLRLLRLVQSRRFFFGEVTEDHLMVLRILFTVFCIVFITGGLIYDIEHAVNPSFETFFDAIYFAIVTLTTVGFGDVTPVTVLGRAVTVVMILVGAIVIPWQLTNLARHLIRGGNKVETLCRHCGLRLHEPDASHCKACGNLIYQEYDGTT